MESFKFLQATLSLGSYIVTDGKTKPIATRMSHDFSDLVELCSRAQSLVMPKSDGEILPEFPFLVAPNSPTLYTC